MKSQNSDLLTSATSSIVSELCFSKGWKDYQLLDFGNYQKLERFGPYVLQRPEPQAILPPSLPLTEWKKKRHAVFQKEEKGEKGVWSVEKPLNDPFWISFPTSKKPLQLKISLSSFKHVGVFPEQASNWEWIDGLLKNRPGIKVLNLFAYTGAASLAAAIHQAEVTHVDSIKPTLSWAKANSDQMGLTNIRWMAEDALKFAQKEEKRGKKYDLIILDPPAYGRGANGEKWELEVGLPLLLQSLSVLLNRPGAILLNMYAMGLSPVIASGLLEYYFKPKAKVSFGELGMLSSSSAYQLPLSTFARFAEWD